MQNNISGRIEFANTLRGFAALSVLISHYFGVFWLAREAVSGLTNAPSLPLETHPIPRYVEWINHFILFNWGAYGVALFFLISGFVIPFSIIKLDWKKFVINRFFRIMPTYVVGFSITLIAIFLCGIYFRNQFPYHAKEVIIHYLPGLHDIFHYTSIDGIIWTLEIEIKFYVICALAAHLFQSGNCKVFLIPAFLGISGILLNPKLTALASQSPSLLFNLLYVYILVSPYIVFMFIGVVFNYVFRKIIEPEKAIFFITLFLILSALIAKSGIFIYSLKYAWSYGFALLTFAFAFANQQLFQSNRIVNFMSDISYPLYVIHGVAGYSLLRILLDMGLKPWVSLLITTFIAVLLAFLLHKLIELPSQKLGKRLIHRARIRSEMDSSAAQAPAG